jgi:hypothetical protein
MVGSGLVSLLGRVGLDTEGMRRCRLALRDCRMVWWDGLLRLVVSELLGALLYCCV